MKRKLLAGKKVLAERSCGDEKCVTPRDISVSSYSRAAARFRANLERVNGRFKRFRVLSTTFRHELGRHAECFHAIANIIQLELELHGA